MSRRRAFGLIAMAVAAALAVCGAIGLFNAVVDPYGIIGWVDRAGFNRNKPASERRVKVIKAAETRRIRPEAVILGTSRSHLAIRTTHPGWGGRRTYNLAFDGATPEEMYAYLRHAQSIHPLKTVVLGLDSWHLLGVASEVRPDFDPALLERPGAPWTAARSRLALAGVSFSMDTAAASWRTLRSQSAPGADWFGDDGQRLGETFFHAPEGPYRRGARAYFLKTVRDEMGFKLPMKAAPAPAQAVRPTRRYVESFTFVERIVEFCRESGVDLRIYITPAHAHQLELAELLGQTPRIERGRARLLAIVDEDAKRWGKAPVPVWDFSGYSSVTTEALPPPGSVAEMRYYWDSSHFKEEVGDWILDRVFGVSRVGHAAPEDFGRRLTPETLEAHHQAERAGREAYARDHPADVALLQTLLAEVRRERGLDPPMRP